MLHTHVNGVDVVVQASSLDIGTEVFEIFSSQATSLMLSIPSSKASKVASSFSTVRTVLLVASPISLLFGKI
jgi:hypothetical protein